MHAAVSTGVHAYTPPGASLAPTPPVARPSRSSARQRRRSKQQVMHAVELAYTPRTRMNNGRSVDFVPEGIKHGCQPRLNVLAAGFYFLPPLLTLFKGSVALKAFSAVTKIALTILPWSLRAKVIARMREKYKDDPNASARIRFIIEHSGETSRLGRANARVIFPLLFALPVLLLGAAIVASLERVPITGRWRLIAVSEEDERELVDSIMSYGELPDVRDQGGSPVVDWVSVLCEALEVHDEGFSLTTGRRRLLGADVLDMSDWRVRWAHFVLGRVSQGVQSLSDSGHRPATTAFEPPPTRHHLHPRQAFADGTAASADAALAIDYDLLVLDRPETNAFSFGFAPVQQRGSKRGVIVIYSGFLDQLAGQTGNLQQPSTQATTSWLSSLRQVSNARSAPPPGIPTSQQSEDLSVLLAHELAHLLLSHTLESYTSSSLLIPTLSRLVVDVGRTVLFPLIVMLGPFINDALNETVNRNAHDGFGLLGKLTSACESRTMEYEADIVALRLLASSGIDPRQALDFWTRQLPGDLDKAQADADVAAQRHLAELSHTHTQRAIHHHNHRHGEHQDQASTRGFLRTHPVDNERLERIRAELASWSSLSKP